MSAFSGIANIIAGGKQAKAATQAANQQAAAAIHAAELAHDAYIDSGNRARWAANEFGQAYAPAARQQARDTISIGNNYTNALASNVANYGQGMDQVADIQARGIVDASNALSGAAGRSNNALQGGLINARGELQAGYTRAGNALQPMVSGGDDARAAYLYEHGLGDMPANYTGFENTPDYIYARDEALDATAGRFAGMGSFNSGAMQKALMREASGMASQNRNNYLGRLEGLMSRGDQARYGMSNLETSRGNALSSIAAQRGQVGAQYHDAMGSIAAQRAQGLAGARGNALANTHQVNFNAMNDAAGQRMNAGQQAAAMRFGSRVSPAEARLRAAGVEGEAIAQAGQAAASGVAQNANALAAGTIGAGNARAGQISAGGAMIGNLAGNALMGYMGYGPFAGAFGGGGGTFPTNQFMGTGGLY